MRELTERELLQQYAPVGVLVNERGDILYIHGRTGQYLEPAAGEASLNILKMAREGLRRHLTTALRKAATQKEPLRQEGIKVKTNGSFSTLNLAVRPVAGAANLLLILFETAPAPNKKSSETAAVENTAEVA